MSLTVTDAVQNTVLEVQQEETSNSDTLLTREIWQQRIDDSSSDAKRLDNIICQYS